MGDGEGESDVGIDVAGGCSRALSAPSQSRKFESGRRTFLVRRIEPPTDPLRLLALSSVSSSDQDYDSYLVPAKGRRVAALDASPSREQELGGRIDFRWRGIESKRLVDIEEGSSSEEGGRGCYGDL